VSAFQERFFTTRDGLRLYYRDYAGPSGRPPILCLAGSTGTVRNYAEMAPHWAKVRRVLCMDWRGHGRSDYDPDYRHYGFQTDADDVLELLRHEQIDRIVLIGSSRGGIIAMVLAEQRPEVLAGVVMNDIGPATAGSGRQRLNNNMQVPRSFASFDEAGAFMKATQVPGVTFTEAEWTQRATEFYRRREDGHIRADVDFGYIKAFVLIPPRDQWTQFDAMRGMPVLVVRGALSDILDGPLLEEMKRRKPDLSSVVVAGRAHCPTLAEPEAREAVDRFLVGV